ncbi:hypothetical protein BI364_14305 [Acidihalobacter yilgarnensis]|uniref:Uncharacterized protein n=1 Tax=Acidihalobacter yilgarnensis TaxID=2819280 RepID=A0A1D8IQZ2_9GAMM|nr:hypothetical protein [Acidihalobacter yilgarnensis]AOU98968.1 hypothetical protein BI364_14305 [Acidihalobacter yilgarnensis]
MKIEMGDDGLEILGLSRDQVALLTEALKSAPNQAFMEDDELRRLYKLMAILQSDLWDDMIAGRFDFSPYRRQ